MISLVTSTPQFYNDICEEIRLFIPQNKIDMLDMMPKQHEGYCITHRFFDQHDTMESTAVLYKDTVKLAEYTENAPSVSEADLLLYKKYVKRLVKISVFRLLSKHFKMDMPWGSLTGIRPSKLARELTQEYGNEQEAKRVFKSVFDVSEEKTRLAFDIAARQKKILESVTEEDTDIYIGIPFCVSRCHYCSFASNDLNRFEKYVEQYLACLFEEIRIVMDALHPKIRSIYIGGGTPTALDAKQLERLLQMCTKYFGTPGEFTVEAGRPDTVTKEKLMVIRDYAKRISINPQTLNDDTLKRIGRAHSSADFFDKFALARECGFDFINADIIAGLPGEDISDVENTINGIASLNPENVTVHTLAIKRASRLHDEQSYQPPETKDAQRMVELCAEVLNNKGYNPYYMYRQKYMMGNLENTGYAKAGFECVYNIDIMEETTSILAFGAGAITKKVLPKENRIERAPNVSDLLNYLARYAEMAERKIKLFSSIKY